MSSPSILDGIIIGASGGAIAGITVFLVQSVTKSISDSNDSKRIYRWLTQNTENSDVDLIDIDNDVWWERTRNNLLKVIKVSAQ